MAGKKATINTKASVERVIGRLSRINIAIDSLEQNDAGFCEVGERNRVKEKLARLRAEREVLSSQLSGVQSAMNKVLT